MSLCKDTPELNIFSADSLKKLIQFKWEGYGRKPHYLVYLMMLQYALILILFTIFVYISPNPVLSKIMGIVLVFSLIPTVGLNSLKLYKYGFYNYWSEPENVLDFIFNVIGVLNFILQ